MINEKSPVQVHPPPPPPTPPTHTHTHNNPPTHSKHLGESEMFSLPGIHVSHSSEQKALFLDGVCVCVCSYYC